MTIDITIKIRKRCPVQSHICHRTLESIRITEYSQLEETHKVHQVLFLSEWPVQGLNQQPRLYQFFSTINEVGRKNWKSAVLNCLFCKKMRKKVVSLGSLKNFELTSQEEMLRTNIAVLICMQLCSVSLPNNFQNWPELLIGFHEKYLLLLRFPVSMGKKNAKASFCKCFWHI